ncbi:MAG: hypothetical protein N3F64_05300 [Nitrososphaeria archaeon]|nr:hypothetical protein [Nitrososphaeria archaeon]
MTRGISRIIEAVVSSLLILSAFSISYYLTLPPNIPHQRSSEDLKKFGYNLLSSLAANQGFDQLIFDSSGKVKQGWEQQFKVVINSFMPHNIIFNISIYNATLNQLGFVELVRLNKAVISNVVDEFGKANEAVFLKAGENVQISYVYTTRWMKVIVIEMKLALLGSV